MKGAFGNEGALRFSGNRRPEAGFFAQEREHSFYQRVGGDAVFFAQEWYGAVFDELIRPADTYDRRIDRLGM
jgi:hypothetical protein